MTNKGEDSSKGGITKNSFLEDAIRDFDRQLRYVADDKFKLVGKWTFVHFGFVKVVVLGEEVSKKKTRIPQIFLIGHPMLWACACPVAFR